jgi:hypothetical protein
MTDLSWRDDSAATWGGDWKLSRDQVPASSQPRRRKRRGLAADQVPKKQAAYPETPASRHRRDYRLKDGGLYPHARQQSPRSALPIKSHSPKNSAKSDNSTGSPSKKRATITGMSAEETGDTGNPTRERIGARLLRLLSPKQLEAVLEDSPLGRLLVRYEKGLREIEQFPADSLETKEQADAVARVGTTLRRLQKVEAKFRLRITETSDQVLQREAMGAKYRRNHDESGAPIPPARRGRPPGRVAEGARATLR